MAHSLALRSSTLLIASAILYPPALHANVRQAIQCLLPHFYQMTPATRVKLSGEKSVAPFDEIRLNSVIAGANLLLGELKRPSQIQVAIHADERTARCDYGAGTLHLGQPAPLRPLAWDTATAHEYAHYVFIENLMSYKAEWELAVAELRKNPETQSQEKDTNKKIHALTESLKNPANNGPIAVGIKKEIELLHKKYWDLVKSKNAEFLIQESTPYAELFSDAVAVVLFQDGKAVSSIIADPLSPYYSENAHHSSSRDFTVKHKASTWVDAEEHGLFAPARRFLLQHYLSLPKNRHRLPLLMERIFRVLAREMLRNATRVPKPSVEALNRGLIQSFLRDLRDFR